ncbi:MAG: DUF899 domain-containing protein [Myxococcota bacterium]
MPNSNEITDKDGWLGARRELLAREKELTRLRDEVSQLRRELPRQRIATAYRFESTTGSKSLSDLFGAHRQLLVYHFMFGTDWDAGCPSCSFWADQFDAMIPHLAQRDSAFVVVSKAPLAKLQAFRERMGWGFEWVSSADSTFNEDFAVSFTEAEVESKDKIYNFGTMAPGREMPGASAFVRDGDDVFRTYSTYSRGLDMLNATYHWLDLSALGRDEAELPWPMAWVKRHDEYGK